jgi:RNA polymerase sigma-70 factor (ECF subfamily)
MQKSDQVRAYESLFRMFQPALVRFAFAQMRNEEEAREAVQEIFIKIWQKRDDLALNEELKPYLYRAVRNNCLNRLKRAKTDPLPEDGAELPAPADQPDDSAENRARIKAIFREIEQLPGRAKEIFLMSRVEGLTHKEIAEVLEITPKTVENQIGISLKKIREGVFKEK